MGSDRYASQRKTSRNQALFKYAKDNQDATLEDIGREFNISKQRVWELLKNEEKKKATEEAVA